MTRVQTILSNARAALADPDKERWSDGRLLALLSKGQIHFATESRLFIATAAINIQLNNAEYSLPTDTFKLVRVVGPYGRIPLVSRYTLDAKDPDWQTKTGTKIEAIVYDVLAPNKFRIYPIIYEQPDAALYTFDSLYGVMVGLDSLECLATTDIYGVVTDTDEYIYAQYIKIPARLAADTDELLVPYVYDDILENYVLAHAFRDDLDTQNRQLGAEYLQLYSAGLATAKEAHQNDNIEGERTHTATRKFF